MRAVALLLVGPFLALASTLAPQHVHEGASHEHTRVHSHFSPHEPSAHHDHCTEIEHDDEPVVWLDGAILHTAPYQTTNVPAASLAVGQVVALIWRWAITPFEDGAPLHGPPKLAHLFRGPPFLV